MALHLIPLTLDGPQLHGASWLMRFIKSSDSVMGGQGIHVKRSWRAFVPTLLGISGQGSGGPPKPLVPNYHLFSIRSARKFHRRRHLRKVRGSQAPVSHVDPAAGDNAAVHNEPHFPPDRPLVSDTTQPNTALQMPQPLAAEHPPLRVTPSHDLRSCTPDMVDNQNTAPLYISASRNDPLSIAHDTAQPDSISPEIISDRRGIKETTYSNVR